MSKKFLVYLNIVLLFCGLLAICLPQEQNFIHAANIVTVNLQDEKQVISGFGGSTAWHPPLTDPEANSLFTTVGLSLLRVRIDPGGAWSDELSNAKKAIARGANVFATPWSPPASMKDNGSIVAGSLKTTEYGNYAAWLGGFGNYMKSNGVSLRAISVQNEPNINVTYESCSWTSAQIRDFIKNYGAAIGYPVMMPETFNYLPSFADVILNDPAACANTSIVAHHWYGANRFQLNTNAVNKGKEIWMTEHYSDDQTLGGALSTAVEIHNFMTINYENAYVWWYVRQPSCNLIQSGGAINPRGYVIGQFAKFVRPGYKRVGATDSGVHGVYVSAYKDPTNKVVVVAINDTTSAKSMQFTLQNGNATSVTPYVTSSNKGLQAQTPVAVSSGSFTATLEASSVTTFVQN